MVRLSNIHRHPFKKRIFYFHTIEDCNEFISIFEKNSCNVVWGEPRKIPDTVKIKNSERELMDESPKQRADRALKWGFEITQIKYDYIKTF